MMLLHSIDMSVFTANDLIRFLMTATACWEVSLHIEIFEGAAFSDSLLLAVLHYLGGAMIPGYSGDTMACMRVQTYVWNGSLQV